MTTKELEKDIEAVRIKHYGACPYHNNHFNWASFLMGIVIGSFVMAFALTILGLHK